MASDGGIKHDVGSAKSRQADHPGVLVFLEADLLQIVLNYVFEHVLPRPGHNEVFDDPVVGAAFTGTLREIPKYFCAVGVEVTCRQGMWSDVVQ